MLTEAIIAAIGAIVGAVLTWIAQMYRTRRETVVSAEKIYAEVSLQIIDRLHHLGQREREDLEECRREVARLKDTIKKLEERHDRDQDLGT
ncbi:MAG: hypothetical protein KatS3mg051_1576 [Anaerolineae bacterium]|nr:MAG: hypothetical protein KatS3mg051_1576 [Anaerolineae bacterium]